MAKGTGATGVGSRVSAVSGREVGPVIASGGSVTERTGKGMPSAWMADAQGEAAWRRKRELIERVRHGVRIRHFSPRTEKAYAGWVGRYLEFHGERVFSQLGEAEVSAFLTSLAVDGAVSASTQNQALYAILFLYRNVLGRDLAWLEDVVRAKRPLRLPTVLARGDVARLIAKLEGTPKLVASLLYGSGLRLLEGLTLRIIGCTGTIYTRP